MEDFSRSMYSVLNRVGFNSDFRKLCLDAASTREVLTRLTTYSYATLRPENPQLINVRHEVGSCVDGTFRDSLNSDLDWLLVLQTYTVGEFGDLYAPYQMYYGDTLAGYVKIKASDTAVFNVEYFKHERNRDGQLFLTHYPGEEHPFTSIQHRGERSGPALTTLPTDDIFPGTGHGLPGTDNVYAYRSNVWPSVANEWFQRQRKYSWPSQETIEEFRSMSCFVVPAAHPHSTMDCHLQWRLSFSLQERHLMLNLTDVQYKCYVLLKMIKEDIITPIVGKSLSSYHCKTTLFYTIEENNQDIWRPEKLLVCLHKCLQRLLDWAEEGVCPNYFLPESNLFAGKVQEDQRILLIGTLTQVLQNLPGTFRSMQCERIAEWIQCTENYDVTKEQELQQHADRGLAISVSVLVNGLADLITQVSKECLQYSLSVGTVEGHLRSLQLLYMQYFSLNESLRESLEVALGYLHASLASHLVCLALQSNSQYRDWYIGSAVYHFIRATTLEDKVSRLKLANVLIVTGHRPSAAKVLQSMDQTVKDVEIMIGLERRYLIRQKYREAIQWFCDIRQIVRLSVGQIVKRFLCGPIIFLPTEIEVTPAALVFEMFRTMGMHGSANIVGSLLYRYYYNWAVVEMEIFFHLMKYLSGLYGNYVEFLQMCYDFKRHTHHDTWWNVISWSARQSDCYMSATMACIQSWLINSDQAQRSSKVHATDDTQHLCNAAKLHMVMNIYEASRKPTTSPAFTRAMFQHLYEHGNENPELLDFLNRLIIPDVFER